MAFFPTLKCYWPKIQEGNIIASWELEKNFKNTWWIKSGEIQAIFWASVKGEVFV